MIVRRCRLIRASCVVALAVLSVAPTFAAEPGSFELTPTPDPESPSGFLIPGDLDEAFAELDRMLPAEIVEEMRTGTEDDMVVYHFGLGMWMRNNWGLWGGSKLEEHLTALGLEHPDDMSAVILESYWRKLNSKPLALEDKVQYYQAYWREWSFPESLACPKHGQEVEIETTREVSEEGEELRVLHIGSCEAEGEFWVYEDDRGLYEPDAETFSLLPSKLAARIAPRTPQ
jgi:hypothetical protein